MAQPATIVLPCRSFDVQVTLHHSQGLSHLEQYVLMALAQGATSIDDLAHLLALSSRMILDVCVDMLEVGYVGVDPHRGTLRISEVVREHMGDPSAPKPNWQHTLTSSAPPEPQTKRLLQDLVSGAVFARRRQPFEPRGGLPVAPIDPNLPTLEEIPKIQLMLAVQEGLRNRDNDRVLSDAEEASELVRLREGRIVDITLLRSNQAAGVASAAETTRFDVYIRMIARESAGEAPEFSLVGPDIVPASVRRHVAAKLSTLWARGLHGEKRQFFSRIKYESRDTEKVEDLFVTDPHASLGSLEGRLRAIVQTEGSDGHEELSGIDLHARAEIAEAISYRGIPSLVRGAKAHHDAVREALSGAEHQVLLANPWVGGLASERGLLNEIEHAIKSRGINVAILWGISAKDDFERSFGPILDRLRKLSESTDAGGRLLVAEQPSQSHAKVIVSDLDWAIVTSCNFLNSGPDRTVDELGVRVRGPKPASTGGGRPVPARAVLEVVEWYKRNTPDYRLQRTIDSSPTLFGREERGQPVPIGVPIHAPAVNLGKLSRDVWVKSWETRVTGYRKALEEAGALLIPTSDEENRHTLLMGLKQAQRRLMVVSPELGGGLLGSVVSKAVMDAARRGVEVTVIHDGWAQNVEAEHRTRHGDLAAVGVRFIADQNTHAKVLICDDWCVVGSFNFLTFEGRGRAELGLRVYDPHTAEQVVEHFASLRSNKTWNEG